MSDQDAPLTERQQLTMAYVDDELGQVDRTRFETMIGEDSELAAEVADYCTLMDMSRSMAFLEPTDREMRRFWARFYNRTEWRVGWTLFVLGSAALVVFGIYELLVLEVSWVFKAAVLCTMVGAGMLLWTTMRLKIRSSRLDRYRGVMR